jgi:hypothetical protein
MTNIAKALAVVLTVAVVGTAFGGLALANPDSPFYPDRFQNPNPPQSLVGAGSGIPAPYRIGD